MKGARKREGGFALLLLVFFTALMLLAVMAATPRILTEAKRQKEQEMIWRGNQYVRGVKLYYRKMGRFPTSLDDLTKPKTGARRFMRQAYKDPMNTGDGSWRLIYVGPAGQLIGSLKPPKTLQIPGVGPGLGASASSVATNSTRGDRRRSVHRRSDRRPGRRLLAAGRRWAGPARMASSPVLNKMAGSPIRRRTRRVAGKMRASPDSRGLRRMELRPRARTRAELMPREMCRRQRAAPRRKRPRLSAEI